MRIVRYFFVGGAAAGVDLALFTLFAKVLGYNYLAVAACTFAVATAINYVLSVRHVFESGVRFTRNREIGLVFLVSAVGLLINQAALFSAVSVFRLPLIASKIVATAIVFGWNYWARANFVFARRA